VIQVGGAEMVLISNGIQALGLEPFQNLRIDAVACNSLVIRSPNHVRSAFGPMARTGIYVQSDGPLGPYTKGKRPIRPLDTETEPGLIAGRRSSHA